MPKSLRLLYGGSGMTIFGGTSQSKSDHCCRLDLLEVEEVVVVGDVCLGPHLPLSLSHLLAGCISLTFLEFLALSHFCGPSRLWHMSSRPRKRLQERL